MNKSDIMKAAELVQETIGWAIIRATQGDLEPLYELAVQVKWGENGKPYFPIAAAELLKQVEVLPEGSEPVVGDVVLADEWHWERQRNNESWCKEPSYRAMEVYSVGENDKYICIGIRGISYDQWKKDGGKRSFPIKQIILRSGKPVIIDKEGV